MPTHSAANRRVTPPTCDTRRDGVRCPSRESLAWNHVSTASSHCDDAAPEASARLTCETDSGAPAGPVLRYVVAPLLDQFVRHVDEGGCGSFVLALRLPRGHRFQILDDPVPHAQLYHSPARSHLSLGRARETPSCGTS